MQWILSTVLGLGVTFSSSFSVFAQTCNVPQIQPGTIALATGNGGRLSSRPDLSPGAQLGNVTLTCSAGMELLIDPPVAQGAPPTDSRGVEVWRGSPLGGGSMLVDVTTSQASTIIPAPINNLVLFLNLYVNSAPGSLLTPGSYTYAVPMRVVPQ